MLEADSGGVWTAAEVESQYSGFVFEGPGVYWFPASRDSMLVVPVNPSEDDPWENRLDRGERFRFYIYHGRNIADIIRAVSQAPIKMMREGSVPMRKTTSRGLASIFWQSEHGEV